MKQEEKPAKVELSEWQKMLRNLAIFACILFCACAALWIFKIEPVIHQHIQAREASVKQKQREDAIYSKIQSTIFSKLKAPATAKLCPFRDIKIVSIKDSETLTTDFYFGYVDSQNSFGAMLRSYWRIPVFGPEDSIYLMEFIDSDGKVTDWWIDRSVATQSEHSL